MMNERKLYLSSIEQKIIFYCEMQGQISDGKWENMRPHNHWRVWSDLRWDDIVVSSDLEGRAFYAPYSKYNFADEKLLEIVGERVIGKIKLYKRYPEIVEPILMDDHWMIPDSMWELTYNEPGNLRLTEYYSKKRKALAKKGLSDAMMSSAWLDHSYTMIDLISDCSKLKYACSIRI